MALADLTPALAAVVGYAVGTAQILALDWHRHRRLHLTQLRVIRADLRQVARARKKFDWDEDGPQDDYLPNPPTVSSKYVDLVTGTDFAVTDEYLDDETQEALLEVVRGCEMLDQYHSRIEELIDQIPREADSAKKKQLRENAKEFALAYDGTLDALMVSADNGIEDLGGRLDKARFWNQVKRQFKRLPARSVTRNERPETVLKVAESGERFAHIGGGPTRSLSSQIDPLSDSPPSDADGDMTFIARCGHQTIACYEGDGVLTDLKGRHHQCAFEACQFQSGRVVLACSFDDVTLLFPFGDSESFRGRTTDGREIAVHGPIQFANYPAQTARDNWATFVGRELIAESPGAQSDNVHTLRFGLTNFFFTGVPTKNDQGLHSNHLPLRLDCPGATAEMLVVRNHDYEAVRECVAAFRGINVSCEVVMEVEGKRNLQEVIEIVDDLCYILSVGMGTKIQWVYCDHYDDAGTRFRRQHGARVTRPYNPLPIIPRTSGESIRQFVEMSFRKYMEIRGPYELKRGTIDAYLDAKATDDFLETRGLKLAIALEELKHVHMEFMGTRLRFFQDKVKMLCKDLNVRYTERELKLVIASRNALVHQGRFYCTAATAKQRRKCEPLPSQIVEYLCLLHFMDRLYLRLFDYEGHYIDWSRSGEPKEAVLSHSNAP